MSITPSAAGRVNKQDRPNSREVSEFHVNADTDGSPKAIHHTLGPAPNQAAAGNHTHDAGASSALTGYATATHTHPSLGAGIRCRLQANATQSINNASVTPVALQTKDWDTNNIADIVNGKLIIKTAGWYRFYFRLDWASNATGYRAGLIYINGVIAFDDYGAPAPAQVTIQTFASEPFYCAVNDSVELRCVHTAGAALLLQNNNGRYSTLSCELASLT